MPLDAARIDAVFAEWDRPDRPGAALGIVQGGELVYARGYGRANLEYGLAISPSSVFHVASVSKQFAAYCVVLLAQEGGLSLDDEVRSLVPDVPNFGPRMSVRHLLTHTSGLRDQWELLSLAGWREADLKTDDDVLALVGQQRALNFAPGSDFVYCNTGFTLLGAIVRSVTGKSLRTFAHERIFEPLDMLSTHFHDDHREVVPGRAYAYVQENPAAPFRIEIPNFDTVGATSLFTTVEDLGRWLANLRAPRIGGDVLAAMAQPASLVDGTSLPYGYGLAISSYRGLASVGHDGSDGGYRAKLVYYPEADLGVVILANLGSIQPDALARGVVDVVLEERLGPHAEPPTPLTAEAAEPYAGLYGLVERGEFLRVEPKDGQLQIRAAAMDTGPVLRPVGDGRFVHEASSLQCQFEPDPRLAGAWQLTVLGGSYGRARTLRPVATPSLNPHDAAQLSGTYVSEELGVHWRLEVRGRDLWLHRAKFPAEPLHALAEDAFGGPEVSILFDRDETGRVSGLRACTGRAWGLSFRRVPGLP